MHCEVAIVESIAGARRHLAGAQPDFVILDLMLPDGDGIDVLRELRRNASPVKVIVTTASSDPERMRDVHALCPHRVVRKPFEVVDLLKAMNMM